MTNESMDLLNVAAPVCSLGCLKIKGFYHISTNHVHRIHKEKIEKYIKRALKEKTILNEFNDLIKEIEECNDEDKGNFNTTSFSLK